MTKQAPHVVALKAAFFKRFEMQINARIAGGSQRDCLVLAVPEFRQRPEIDRALLIDIGIWLESRGYYLCEDYGRVGLLASPSGWTCWNAGVSVKVRFWPDPAGITN
ncbi:hypothetical protein [Pseudomonas quasicaspiana]|uniref:hypothetical protein n=1 Tax=Pseudomonas quasicaspiana TaxID=2829821 RepID=UPI001E395674|nr:hypothetical protein [Pseudomonas quasicaspiana]MCD5980528.1 hypothetical protein [Pseudomonas quasicaspiana]